MCLSVTVALILAVCALVWGYSLVYHNYWRSRGVSGPTPKPLIGNFDKLYFGKRWEYSKECYFKYKNEKVFGTYEGHKPFLFLCDPEMIKEVLVKEFSSFGDRRHMEFFKPMEWMGEMLSATNGESWKKLRSTMSPTFSSGKIKNMYNIVNEQAQNFLSFCKNKNETNNSISIKDAFGRFTIDVIAQSAFGIKCDSLIKDDAIFAMHGEQAFSTSTWNSLSTSLFFVWPRVSLFLNIIYFIIFKPVNPWGFFYEVATSTIESRKKDGSKRGDFLGLMLEEQNSQKEKFDATKDYMITDSTLHAQCVLFLVAGYDTTANALSVTSYCLAKSQKSQSLLREELQNIINSEGKFEYHNIMEAKYLDACISEALRLYPIGAWLERQCTADYKFKNSNIKLNKHDLVAIPIWGLHYDPEFWDDPEVYNPERFLPENKIHQTPFTYMPFGIGPRNCIAMRFALMEIKLCLAYFVLNYNFTLAPGHEELKLTNGGNIIKPVSDSIMLNLNKL